MRFTNRIWIEAVSLCVAVVGVVMPSVAVAAGKNAEMDEFVNALMDRMTLEEKLGQLNLVAGGSGIVTGDVRKSRVSTLVSDGRLGGVFNIKSVSKIRELQDIAVNESRLGIPLIVGMDVIHGYETVFPIPLALSCSWDMEAIERSARIAAKEASAAGVCWTYSPMVDISRDPRWGRMAEGAGEDPYLGAQVAKAMVRGYQGPAMKRNDEIMACAKHFALYGAPDGGRDYNTVDMSRIRMYNEYFEPYKAAVEAGVGSIMTSFNTVDGVPATANRWLLTDVLRDQWHFDGFVVTDYGTIVEMESHGTGDLSEASVKALRAGTDMDMMSDGYIKTLGKSVADGKVTVAEVDKAVRRVLEAKYRLGLFGDPYKYIDETRAEKEIYAPEHRAEARRIAAETFVLLKNDDNLLPLSPKGKIALIGPLADAAAEMPGTWSVAADVKKYKSLLQGFREAVGTEAEVLYAKGSNFTESVQDEKNITRSYGKLRDARSDEELLKEALAVASQADVIVAALGEGAQSSGESSCRTDLSLYAPQRKLLDALLATGKPVVMLNFAGRPTVLSWEAEHVPAILNVWFGGSEAPDAIADVVFGKVSPSGKLTASMPRSVGQIPVYYNHFMTGRPANESRGYQRFRSNYLDVPNTPLYPFGYGLSYTVFDYSDVTLSSDKLASDGCITAYVTVTNTGDRAGDEIVQFYIRDMSGSVSRPVKELKHFDRISLKPGESRMVEFKITPDDLKFYNYDLEYVAEPGEFMLMAGPDSERLKTVKFSLMPD